MDTTNWLDNPNEWQFIDLSNGYIYPWITMDSLLFLNTLDVSEWTVFEFGTGASTLWWANKCKRIVTLDVNPVWYEKVRRYAQEKGLKNIEFHLVDLTKHPLRETACSMYLDVLRYQEQKFDAVIVDASFRDEASILADKHIKEQGWIIADNWKQQGIWDCLLCDPYLQKRYSVEVYKQSPIPDPENHPWIWNGNEDCFFKIKEGHPHWQTAFWRI
jgi:hypothetical protein